MDCEEQVSWVAVLWERDSEKPHVMIVSYHLSLLHRSTHAMGSATHSTVTETNHEWLAKVGWAMGWSSCWTSNRRSTSPSGERPVRTGIVLGRHQREDILELSLKLCPQPSLCLHQSSFSWRMIPSDYIADIIVKPPKAFGTVRWVANNSMLEIRQGHQIIGGRYSMRRMPHVLPLLSPSKIFFSNLGACYELAVWKHINASRWIGTTSVER